jgi:molybdopterin/thiamine biosynthesis adenylyltransferase
VNDAAMALARTVQLIADDVFNTLPGEDPDLDAAILDGLGTTTVRIVADRENLSSAAGQTALVTLVGQIAMMGIGIDLKIPAVPFFVPQPPVEGDELRAGLLAYSRDLIPGARIGSDIGPPDLTLVLGDTDYPDDGRTLRVSGDAWRCTIAAGASGARWRGRWPIGALAAAGAAAPEAFRAALARVSAAADRPLPPQPGFELRLDRPIRLDLSIRGVRARPLQIGPTDAVSGGAITTSMLYCLLRIPGLSGDIRVIERDTADVSNLNRYPLLRRSDCGRGKADLLSGFGTRSLRISAAPARFDATTADALGPLASRVLIGVDDIPSRWEVQRAAPGWVCVAGTTHLFALVTTHEQGAPCAGCAHPRDEELDATIPTISFVSFWAGLMQARELLRHAAGVPASHPLINIWSAGLYGPRALQAMGLASNPDCPVQCRVSRGVA